MNNIYLPEAAVFSIKEPSRNALLHHILKECGKYEIVILSSESIVFCSFGALNEQEN